MQDQMSGAENAGPENAGPENQDRKMEDERLERVFCRGNMRDCLRTYESIAIFDQYLALSISKTIHATVTMEDEILNVLPATFIIIIIIIYLSID